MIDEEPSHLLVHHHSQDEDRQHMRRLQNLHNLECKEYSVFHFL